MQRLIRSGLAISLVALGVWVRGASAQDAAAPAGDAAAPVPAQEAAASSPATTQATTQPAPAGFETVEQRSSYSIGLDIGRNLKQLPIQMDGDLLARGIKDAMTGAKPVLSEEQARAALAEFKTLVASKMEDQAKQAGAKNAAESKAFFDKNGKGEGVKTTASGLQYKVLEEGKGKSPKATDNVTVHYRGTLLDGTQFDSSYDRGQPVTFPLNKVIAGWTEGVQLMKEGGKAKFWIPGNLAYGENPPPGSPITPNATLVFDIELISVEGQ